MKRLLKLEFRKIFMMKTLYICLVIMVAMVLLTAITYLFMNKMMLSVMEDAPVIDANTFIRSALSGSSINIFLAVLIPIYLCSDYSNGTAKGIFAKGYSRTEVYFTKLIGALFISVFFVLTAILFCVIFGVSMFERESVNGETFKALFVQFMVLIAYSSIFCFLSTAFSKLSGAIICSILSTLVILLVFSLFDVIIEFAFKVENVNITDYWLDGIIMKMTQTPLESKDVIKSVMVSLAYTVVFSVAGVFVCKRKEF